MANGFGLSVLSGGGGGGLREALLRRLFLNLFPPEDVSLADLIRQQATLAGIPPQEPATQASLLQAIQQAAVSPAARASAAQLTPAQIGFVPKRVFGPQLEFGPPPEISQALQAPLGFQQTLPFQRAAALPGGGLRIPRGQAAGILLPQPPSIEQALFNLLNPAQQRQAAEKKFIEGGAPGVGTDVEAVSLELTGRPFQQAMQSERVIINRVVQQRAVERQVAGATGKVAGLRELPMDVTLLGRVYNPETLTPFPPGTSEAEAIRRGGVKASDKQLEGLGGLDEIEAQVLSIGELSSRLITATSGPAALLQGAALSTGALTRTNDLARAYQDTRQAFLGKLQKSLGGEVGVLTNQDILRVTNALPSFSDTAAVREFKNGLLRLLVELGREKAKRKIFGLAVPPDLDRRIKGLVDQLEGLVPAPPVPQSQPPASPPGFDAELKKLLDAGLSKQEAFGVLRQRGQR